MFCSTIVNIRYFKPALRSSCASLRSRYRSQPNHRESRDAIANRRSPVFPVPRRPIGTVLGVSPTRCRAPVRSLGSRRKTPCRRTHHRVDNQRLPFAFSCSIKWWCESMIASIRRSIDASMCALPSCVDMPEGCSAL